MIFVLYSYNLAKHMVGNLMSKWSVKYIIGVIALYLSSPVLSQERNNLPVLLIHHQEKLQEYLMNHLSGIANGYKFIELDISRSGKVSDARSKNFLFTEDSKFTSLKDSLDREFLLKLQFYAMEKDMSLKLRLYMVSYAHSFNAPVTECDRIGLSAINVLRIMFENEKNDGFRDSRTGKELDYVVHNDLIILKPVLRMAIE